MHGRSTREVVVDVDRAAFEYGTRRVLDDVQFHVRRGEIVSVMGPSGCGKTTLLKLLVGLEKPCAGSVRVLGESVAELDEDRADRFRRRIGMCFQFGALLNSLTVYENLALPLREAGGVQESLIATWVRAKLALVGIPGCESQLPSELSGGMRKRAGLARALMLDPELLFFDEPSSGLDPVTAAELDQTILALRERLDTGMVVVTHDLESALGISDWIVVMLAGRVAVQGTVATVRECADPQVAAFLQRRPSPPRPRTQAPAVAAWMEEES